MPGAMMLPQVFQQLPQIELGGLVHPGVAAKIWRKHAVSALGKYGKPVLFYVPADEDLVAMPRESVEAYHPPVA